MSRATFKNRMLADLVLTVAALAVGCGTNGVILNDDATGAGGAGGMGGSTAGTGGGDACQGQCAPLGPGSWLGPLLVWIGKDGEAPDCPASAPVADAPMFADLDAPTLCGACKCDAPTGTCALPGMFAAAAATCAGNGPGVPHTSFDAPAGWDGSCTAASPIPALQKCGGFNVNCVQSLTLPPLTLTEMPCGISEEPIAAKLPYTWGTVARSCHGTAYGRCATPAETCAPAPEPGFTQCLVRDGDRECPAADYTVKHVFYAGVLDTRECSPCACSTPVGSTCSAIISVFNDGSCSPAALVVAGSADAVSPTCHDVTPSGQALLSKLATAPVYAPGACQVSGGEPMGQALPEDPTTYCCLP